MKHSITEVLERFENGQELYNTSALFNYCINYLAIGGDIYKILEKVITMNEEQRKITEQIILKSGVPITFTCEKEN